MVRILTLIAALLFPVLAFAQITSGPVPTSSANIGITAKTSTTGETAHVIRAAPGNLYGVYATNFTSSAGFLVVVNATAAPSTGALTGATVLDCVALPASGSVSISYQPNPPKVYSIGIVALLTSASNCFTYTTGTITGFISGSAP